MISHSVRSTNSICATKLSLDPNAFFPTFDSQASGQEWSVINHIFKHGSRGHSESRIEFQDLTGGGEQLSPEK